MRIVSFGAVLVVFAVASAAEHPAGRALVEKQPELTRKSFEMDQKSVMRIMPKIMAFRPEVKKKDMPEPVEGTP